MPSGSDLHARVRASGPKRRSGWTPKPTSTSADGVEAGEVADRYVRITVYLRIVLFLVGISGHFRVPIARYGLVGAQRGHSSSLVLLITSPSPP